MQSKTDIRAMTQQLLDDGFTAEQNERFEQAFKAAKIAAGTVLCARYGVGAAELIEAMLHSKNINAEMERLVARIEMEPEFVRFIHSGLDF
jgi:hypothetical protein